MAERDDRKPAEQVVALTPASLRLRGYAPTIVHAGHDPVTGDAIIEVSAPHATSEARLTLDDQVSVALTGPAEHKKRREARALSTLVQRLKAEGSVVSGSTDEAKDGKGEDAFLFVHGVKYTVQLTVTPGDSEFWRKARIGTAKDQAVIDQAVEWLRATILEKTEGRGSIGQRERATTILAIDAQHAGIVASARVVSRYEQRFGPPAREFGFASVWIVGPTVEYCARLGEGTP
jgi:hypothetical protein